MGQVVDDILDVNESMEELRKTTRKDLVADKLTYPKVLGVDKSKEIGWKLVEDSKEILAGFDTPKIALLFVVTNYIVGKIN